MIARRRVGGPVRRGSRRASHGDDRGSIAILLLVVLVGVTLAGLLVPMIITQNRSTRFATSRGQALDAAQAGLDMMLGKIRRATNGDSDPTGGASPGTKGDASKLPCPTAPNVGYVNGSPAQYSVSVVYFSADPIQNPSATIPCSSSGTLTGTAIPKYARLTSTGTVPPVVNGSTSGRTLVTTYQFRSTNVVGGLIAISPASAGSVPLCMDAGAAPYSGLLVVMQPCSTASPPVPRQLFIYRNDLTIKLVYSVTGVPNGLCLTQPTGTAVSLSACSAPGVTPSYTQQWSLNQYGAYQATVARSTIDGSLGSQCLNLASQVAAAQLTMAACDYTAANPAQTAADPLQSWVPAPGVGMGAVTLPQWTSYSDFGRCVYIPPANAATDHLWSYPCTQNPWPLAVPASQSFTGPALVAPALYPVGPITSGSGAAQTCLTTPSTGGWVTSASCSGGTLQSWTVNNGLIATYSDKYTITIKNSTGVKFCLGLGGPAAVTEKWSVIQTEPCTGAADQKWNVPPNALSLTLQNAGS